MAYDEDLTDRFRDTLGRRIGISEKRMMGGACFFLSGNMIGGADRTKDGVGRFMFRVGKDNETEALSRDGATIMEQGFHLIVLDDPEIAKPKIVVYASRAPSWDYVDPELPSFPEMPEGGPQKVIESSQSEH